MRYECWGGPADGWRGDLQVISKKLAVPMLMADSPEWAIYEQWDRDEYTVLYKFVKIAVGTPDG